ncbi:restriction endonuclease subunit S [Slackia equolifaciens]|uniref:restriction endonuclease subunit S n=1 Tax=Slackia equolifaciens TaxID=498718 RepID=UPI001C655550|nr:restriction endonuclease subunit S [Slackia equolifaciens]
MTRIELGEICRYRTESAPINPSTYISTESMLPDKAGIKPAASIPISGKARAFRRGDTLVSNIRPYFKKIWQADHDGCCSADVLIFEPHACHPDYLYWLLSDDSFFDHVVATSKGTKMPRGDKAAIMHYEFEKMDEGGQRTIAKTLNPIRNLIALNQRINDYLEQCALAIYKEKFEYSDETLPVGWSWHALSEFFPVKTGKKDANVAVEGGKYPFFTCSQSSTTTNAYSFEGDAILVAGNGNFNVKWFRGKFEAYQRTYVLMPENGELLGWLYCAVKRNLEFITQSARGSVIKFITKGNIADYKIAVPQDVLTNEYVKQLNQLLLTVEESKKEIAALSALRDILLPKLMSGEIDVSNIELSTPPNNHLSVG